MIPPQLQKPEFRFLLLKKKDKRPVEVEWQNKNNYKFDNPKLINHINSGGNYGIIGGFGNLILIDADSEEINNKCKLLPETFKVKTGSPDHNKNHYYFISDKEMKPIRLSRVKVGDIGDIRSTSQYVVAPNSTHPSGLKYKVANDIQINSVTENFVKSIFKDYFNLFLSSAAETKNKKDFKIDTTKRLSEFTKNCKIPDYVLNNELPKNISKNWKLFPYVIDVLNARDVSDNLYEKLAEKQNHDIGAVKGWVKNAKEGTLAKTSCKKMREYLEHYTPELVEEICGECKLYKKIKEEREKENEEKLKEKLLEEHKNKLSENESINELLTNPKILELFNQEFEKKIVKEYESRKTIFMINNMCNVENLGKATDNLMLNAPTGIGKDHISEAVFEIFPEEEKEELIRTTPKVLAYTRNRKVDPKATWQKIRLRLEDVGNSVLNDDCFKVISSANSNKINKAKIVNKGAIEEIEIFGKPSITITIADANPREEMLRRFPICDLDEGINQTKEILKRQAEFAIKGKTIDYDPIFTDALRCLKRVKVKVPYAEELVKIFCPENAIVRTHFPRFLDYIKSSCSFHQYQRQQDEDEYYLAEKQDYDVARMMLIKTTTNILMIPLTQLLQKIMKVFEDNNLQNKSVDDLQDYEGVKKINIDIEWFRKKLNWLTSKGFLLRDSERRFKEDGKPIPKPVYVYSLNKMQKLEIPKWEEISSFTLVNKNTTNTTNTTNTRVIEVNELFVVKKHPTEAEKQQKNTKDTSKEEEVLDLYESHGLKKEAKKILEEI